MGLWAGLLSARPLFLCSYYTTLFRPRQHISYKISWFHSNMFITCKLYILLYRDYQKKFRDVFRCLCSDHWRIIYISVLGLHQLYIIVPGWSRKDLYIYIYISVGDYLGRCQAVSVPIVSGSGGCYRSGFLWSLQAVAIGWTSSGVGISAGFLCCFCIFSGGWGVCWRYRSGCRDNAGWGVLV